jgi:hypothetical protein
VGLSGKHKQNTFTSVLSISRFVRGLRCSKSMTCNP